jgi:hypothetical protein
VSNNKLLKGALDGGAHAACDCNSHRSVKVSTEASLAPHAAMYRWPEVLGRMKFSREPEGSLAWCPGLLSRI